MPITRKMNLINMHFCTVSARHANLLALDERTSFFHILIGEQLLKYHKFSHGYA